MVGVLSDTGGERSTAELKACNPACATPLNRRERYRTSQPPTPSTAPLSVMKHIRSIRTIARLSFRWKVNRQLTL